jgi:hypothetical protein
VQRPGAGAFVGRNAEILALRAALDDVLAGRGSLVLLVGEPGIGKTRLAEELSALARTAGAEVLWGRSWEGAGAPALWPWVQILRSAIASREPSRLRAELGGAGGTVAHVAPELLERLPDLVVPVLPAGEAGRFRLLDAVATVLRRAAGARPLVLVLDDLHWADEPSLELLHLLSRDPSGAPILIVGTYRDTDVDRDERGRLLGRIAREGTSNVLRGFGADDVRALVTHTTGIDPSPSLVGAVVERTDGNPLFVGELVRLLVAEGALAAPGSHASWIRQIPGGVHETIRRRTERLPPACAVALGRAAVVGREFELRVVDGMRSDEAEATALEVIDAAIAARLVAPAGPGRYRFAHALVRDTLYVDLPAADRVRLHRAAGRALEAVHAADLEPHLAELAHHFIEAAADGDAEKGLGYAEAAARRALAVRGYEDAVRLYELALAALADTPGSDDAGVAVRRTRLLLALADARSMASDDQETRDAYAEVAEMAERVGLAEELALAALGSGGRGDMAAAPDPRLIALLERALAALGPSDSTLRSRVLSRLSAALTLIPDTRARREHLAEEAIGIAERTGDAGALAFALAGRQLALYGPGHLDDRARLSARLLDVAEHAGSEESLVMGLQWRAHALLEAGDVIAGDQVMQRYARLSDELRQPGYQVHMAEWRAMRALHDGRLVDAEGLIAAMLALGQHGDPMNTQMRWVSQMCALRREQGRLDEMIDAIFAVVAAMPSMPAFRGGAAVAAIETGREAEARAHFETLAADDFASFPRDAAWAGGMAQLARVCAALEDAPRAAVLYDLLLPDAERNLVIGFANVSEGAASHFLGMLAATQGRDEEAARHFEAALLMNARMGARPALAHTQREYAKLCLRRHDGGRADELLAAAVGTYEALGMTTFVERTRALRATSGTPAARTDGAGRGANVFVREGDYWTVTYDGAVVRLKDGKGLRYVAELLRSPGRRTHVLDLVAAVDGGPGDGAQRPGAIPDGPDARARTAYRQRAAELQDALAEAERQNDIGRTARLRAEIDQIGVELASAYGMGLERRANDAVERARKAVTNRIRSVVDHLREQHAPLARHLSTSFKLGTWCSYEPEAPVGWRFGG